MLKFYFVRCNADQQENDCIFTKMSASIFFFFQRINYSIWYTSAKNEKENFLYIKIYLYSQKNHLKQNCFNLKTENKY